MKDYSSMTVQERIEDVFAYLAVCRQMEAMLPERIEILEMGLRALEDKTRKEKDDERCTSDLDQKMLQKVVAMFTPVEHDFLNFSKEEVVKGPNDRAILGFDTHFPVKWLVEDYNFTDEEARHFVNMVNKQKGDT